MKCPLCNSVHIKEIENIDNDKLVKTYKKLTNSDFSYLLNKNIILCECQKCKLKFYDPLIAGDENFYNSLQKFDWYYMDEKEEYKYAEKFINSSDKVLEIGSGKGAFVKYLSTKNYIGLDFSKKAKKMAAENGILIENELIQDYSEKHMEEFDIVVSFQVLEHVPDPKEFIEAKLSAIKDGGKLIIAVPADNSFLRYVTNGILNMPPHHVTRWSDETLKFIAKEYNLKLIKLYHEKIQEVHKMWYLSTLIQNSLLSNKLIDNSLKRKIILKLCGVFSRLLYKGFKDEMLPNGHTVLVVYEKL